MSCAICYSVNSCTKIDNVVVTPGPKVIQLFSCSTQLTMKFILLINVKMATIFVGILKFISMINTTSERVKAINFSICRFSFNEQLKFHVQLS